MVIISQTKDRIFNFHTANYIAAHEDGSINLWTNCSNGRMKIGQYNSQERAKNILIEICECTNEVYQMPDY